MNKKIIISFVALCLDTNDDDSLSEQLHDDDRMYTHSSGIFGNISEDGLAENADYILEGTVVKAKPIGIPRNHDPRYVYAVTEWTIKPDTFYKGEAK